MSRNKKVMIVDDDGNIAELIALYLNKEGYDTRKYYNASSALEDFSKICTGFGHPGYYASWNGWICSM